MAPWLCYSRLRRPPGTRLAMIEGSEPTSQRNAVMRALSRDDEWVLMLEDDHMYDGDALERLLSHGVPLVAALIPQRKPPFAPCALRRKENEWYTFITPEECASGGLVSVDAVGLGFTLIRRGVIEAVGDPWFETGRIKSTANMDDLWFCRKVREAGFPVYVDTGVRVAHLVGGMVRFDDQGAVQFALLSDIGRETPE